jgi:hypothetical protein
MGARTFVLNLAPLAGRGRIALRDPGEGVQVSRHRYARRGPLTRTLSPQERGEGAAAPHTLLSSPGLTGRPSTPRLLGSTTGFPAYWMPAFAGMTSGGAGMTMAGDDNGI